MDIDYIIKEYINGSGLETIAKNLHIGKLKVKSILIENGITIRGKGNFVKSFECNILHESKTYVPKDGMIFVAVCKKTKKQFYDYTNESGALTSHVKKVLGIDLPSAYIRNKIYEKTNRYWFEEYFDIIEIDKPAVKKCIYCDWKTTDINNSSGAYRKHLEKFHNIKLCDYLSDKPSESEYFNTSEQTLKTSDECYVICPICGCRLKKITPSHLKKHGITMYDFVVKYPNYKICSIEQLQQLRNAQSLSNLSVNKTRFISKGEKGIQNFLESNNIYIEKNRQILNGQEIDILIPDVKIGIEYNGCKWHTEWFGKKDMHYHINKTNICLKNGYKLIHIFEDEWITKQEIVLSKLSSILKLKNNNGKIDARKTQIREITKYDARYFLDKNHIQGYVSSSIYIGAFMNDLLIGVMSFKKLDNDNWDLNRFSTDINYSCRGVGGKLFSHFIRKYSPKNVVSFADRRWTLNQNDNIYIKLGFKFVKSLKPDYKYYNASIDRYKRFHKKSFTKNKLHKKYGLPLSMTETEMVKQLGYDRIWDCGLFKYCWTNC